MGFMSQVSCKKENGSRSCRSPDSLKRALHRLDGGRLLALRAVLDLELDLLVLLEGLEARTLDLGEVREEVLAAAIGFDEAEAFGVVEPFHGTGAHCVSFR